MHILGVGSVLKQYISRFKGNALGEGWDAVVPLLTRMKAKSNSLIATVTNQLDMDKKTKVVQHRAGLVSDK